MRTLKESFSAACVAMDSPQVGKDAVPSPRMIRKDFPDKLRGYMRANTRFVIVTERMNSRSVKFEPLPIGFRQVTGNSLYSGTQCYECVATLYCTAQEVIHLPSFRHRIEGAPRVRTRERDSKWSPTESREMGRSINCKLEQPQPSRAD